MFWGFIFRVQIPRVGVPGWWHKFPCSSGRSSQFVRSLMTVGPRTGNKDFGKPASLPFLSISVQPFCPLLWWSCLDNCQVFCRGNCSTCSCWFSVSTGEDKFRIFLHCQLGPSPQELNLEYFMAGQFLVCLLWWITDHSTIQQLLAVLCYPATSLPKSTLHDKPRFICVHLSFLNNLCKTFIYTTKFPNVCFNCWGEKYSFGGQQNWSFSLPILHVFHSIKSRLVTFRKGFICHNSAANRTFPCECFWKCMAIPSLLYLAVLRLPKLIAFRFLLNAVRRMPSFYYWTFKTHEKKWKAPVWRFYAGVGRRSSIAAGFTLPVLGQNKWQLTRQKTFL